jgi:peptidoglycan/xylan/chitin deacetylase (PgdA/CDA1 family)
VNVQASPRDFIGTAGVWPADPWPDGARICLSIVVNYEEGAENCVLHGDETSESVLTDTFGTHPKAGRDLTVEHNFEYGARVGFWRLHRMLVDRELPVTAYAAGMALERNPFVASAMAEAGWEVASHGYRWIDHSDMCADLERRHIRRSVDVIERLVGRRPVGYYCGRPSPRTRRLVVEEGGFLYDSDAGNDELPYWTDVGGRSHLVIPQSLETTDARCARGQDFARSADLHDELVDDFEQLYAEGASTPRLMTVAVHCRLAGRPGRAAAFARFLDHVLARDGVRIMTREGIARHWLRRFPPEPDAG